MTCRDCSEFIADYLAGELPSRLREAFERHLERCPNCRVYLASYEATVRMEKAACSEGGEAPLPEELIKAIMAARRDVP